MSVPQNTGVELIFCSSSSEAVADQTAMIIDIWGAINGMSQDQTTSQLIVLDNIVHEMANSINGDEATSQKIESMARARLMLICSPRIAIRRPRHAYDREDGLESERSALLAVSKQVHILER